MRYTHGMETVVLAVLAAVIALVAIDAIARLDERSARRRDARHPPREPSEISTQTIVVDLSKRSLAPLARRDGDRA